MCGTCVRLIDFDNKSIGSHPFSLTCPCLCLILFLKFPTLYKIDPHLFQTRTTVFPGPSEAMSRDSDVRPARVVLSGSVCTRTVPFRITISLRSEEPCWISTCTRHTICTRAYMSGCDQTRAWHQRASRGVIQGDQWLSVYDCTSTYLCNNIIGLGPKCSDEHDCTIAHTYVALSKRVDLPEGL